MDREDYDLHYPPIAKLNQPRLASHMERREGDLKRREGDMERLAGDMECQDTNQGSPEILVHRDYVEQDTPNKITGDSTGGYSMQNTSNTFDEHRHTSLTLPVEDTQMQSVNNDNMNDKNSFSTATNGDKGKVEKIFHFSYTNSDTCSKSNSFAYDISKDTALTEHSYYSDGYFNSSLEKLYARYMSQKRRSVESAEDEPTGCFDKTNESEKSNNQRFGSCSRKQFVVISMTVICMVVAATAAAVLTLNVFHHNTHHYHGEQHAEEQAEIYKKAAVVTGSSICTRVGADILRKNGSAVDAAIAACFCLCVTAKHSTSIGGGGFMLHYNRTNRGFRAYDFSSTAPGKAKMNMYDGNETKPDGKYIGVPGIVKGLREAWKNHGVLEWHQLLEPAINLTKYGLLVQIRSHEIAELMKLQLEDDVGLRKILLSTNREPWFPGHVIYDAALSKTLEIIAKNPSAFYVGNLATKVARDIVKQSGLISLDDLANYQVKEREVISTAMNSFQLFSIGAPTGGPAVIDLVNILKGYQFTVDDVNEKDVFRTSATYHRIIEAIKFAFAHRTREGDPDYNDKDTMQELIKNMTDEGVGAIIRQKIDDIETKDMMHYEPMYSLPEDEGTSQICVVAPNGDAVSMTTTLNGWYGSIYRSLDTGIIYNNQMKAFSTTKDQLDMLPPSNVNSVHGGKRPLSSITPIIMLDKKDNVRFVIGGSGGAKIIPAVAQVLMNKLWFNDELGQALSRPRIFHDLLHLNVTVEQSFDENVLEKLKARKHQIRRVSQLEYSAVQAIYVDDQGEIHAKSDSRKYGHTDGF